MTKSRNDDGRQDGYVLGHSGRELDRLAAQARVLDPITRRFFHDAGIVPDLRVLDVGSGAGDVAFLVADLVGDTGEVVGVDRAPGALAAARSQRRPGRSAMCRFARVIPRRWCSSGSSTRSSAATS